MFENPFSFQGRIRRLYYGLSILIIYAVLVLAIIAARFGIRSSLGTVVPMILIPMYWFLFAQGAKRCHDLGKSGWWQLIPFFVLWMLFADGESGPNEYGENPKAL